MREIERSGSTLKGRLMSVGPLLLISLEYPDTDVLTSIRAEISSTDVVLGYSELLSSKVHVLDCISP